jgi:hypothetical protein
MILIYKHKAEYDKDAGSMTIMKADFVAFRDENNQFSVVKSRYTLRGERNIQQLVEALKTTIQEYSNIPEKMKDMYFETLADDVEEIVKKGIRYKRKTIWVKES